MRVLLLWGASLPIGYFVIARYYPEKRLSWRELGGMAFLVTIWPLVSFVMFVKNREQ